MARDSISFRVDADEIMEAARELADWRGDAALLPRFLRDRIDRLDTDRPEQLCRIVYEGETIRAELTPELRALLGSLRAYRVVP